MEAGTPAHGDTSVAPRQRKCESPKRTFAVLTFFCIWSFADRGIIASNAINGRDDDDNGAESSGLEGDIEMSHFQNGLLSSLLTIGLAVGCPLTARLSRFLPPLMVIGVGMLLWATAAAAIGLAQEYYSLAVSRFLMGVAQYPVLSLGSIIIDDIAPEANVTLWFGLFYISGPVGVALGFLMGPASSGFLSWRCVFPLEAAVVLPFVLLCFVTKPFDIRTEAVATGEDTNRHPDSEDAIPRRFGGLKKLLAHVVFDFAVAGEALYMAFASCMEFWGSRATESMFGNEDTDLVMGIAIVLGSVIGGLSGGALLDAIESSTFNALHLAAIACAVTCAVFIPSVLFVRNFYLFMAFLFICFSAVFFAQGPLAGATLWSVPFDLRPLSRDVRILATQVLGSIPAPALYGVILDVVERNENKATAYRFSSFILSFSIFAAAAVFAIATYISRKNEDYRVRAT